MSIPVSAFTILQVLKDNNNAFVSSKGICLKANFSSDILTIKKVEKECLDFVEAGFLKKEKLYLSKNSKNNTINLFKFK